MNGDATSWRSIVMNACMSGSARRTIAALLALGLAGCGAAPPAPSPRAGGPTGASSGKEDPEAAIQSSLAELSVGERKMALAQKFCPVMEGSRLGSMGVPTKVMVKDEPVFVCCKGCVRKAQRDADKTLAKTLELRANHGPKKQ